MLPLTKTIDIMACENFVVMMKQMEPCVLIAHTQYIGHLS